jgi:hypothetical protein
VIPTAEATGNPWLAPNLLVAFIAELEKYEKSMEQIVKGEGQMVVTGEEMTLSQSKQEASLDQQQGQMELAQGIAQATNSFAQAGTIGGGMLGKGFETVKPRNSEESKEIDTAIEANKNRIQQLKTRNSELDEKKNTVFGSAEKESEQTQNDSKRKIDKEQKANSKEMDKLDKENQDYKIQKNRLNMEQKRMNMQNWDDGKQLILSVLQGTQSLTDAIFKWQIAQIESEKALLHGQQQINQTYTSQAVDAYKSAQDRIGQVLQDMTDQYKSFVSTFQYGWR